MMSRLRFLPLLIGLYFQAMGQYQELPSEVMNKLTDQHSSVAKSNFHVITMDDSYIPSEAYRGFRDSTGRVSMRFIEMNLDMNIMVKEMESKPSTPHHNILLRHPMCFNNEEAVLYLSQSMTHDKEETPHKKMDHEEMHKHHKPSDGDGHTHQGGKKILIWTLIYGNEQKVYFISASFPEEAKGYYQQALLRSVLSSLAY